MDLSNSMWCSEKSLRAQTRSGGSAATTIRPFMVFLFGLGEPTQDTRPRVSHFPQLLVLGRGHLIASHCLDSTLLFPSALLGSLGRGYTEGGREERGELDSRTTAGAVQSGQVNSALWASVYPPIKWLQMIYLPRLLWRYNETVDVKCLENHWFKRSG